MTGITYLNVCALVRERRAEVCGYDVHDSHCHIVLQLNIGMLAVSGGIANLEMERVQKRCII